MVHTTDLELTAAELGRITSADAVAALLDRLGYGTASRTALSPEAIGYVDTSGSIRDVELLAEDDDGFLRVLFVRVQSITANVRNGLTRTLGRRNEDYLLILTSDFDQFELVLIDKLKHRKAGPGTQATYKPVAKTFGFSRKTPDRLTLRILRRLTFTAADGLLQYDKIRHAFDAAIYSGRYFQNRALFADHYLEVRLPELAAWRENPAGAFGMTRELLTGAHQKLLGKDEQLVREQLYQPVFDLLGFKAKDKKLPTDGSPAPDYLLHADGKQPLTAALVYRWDRWLDGPDYNDPDTPDENPGAAVVTLLEEGVADWIIVTNGRLWRLYSAKAHSRSTNFYEVDLEEALLQAGETDPNEAFRYWWLFFRRQAFELQDPDAGQTWLDFVASESRAYAREVEAKLKRRVFEEVVPQLAAGFLADRRERLGQKSQPSETELEDIRQATLTLLYRILFLLYAEARDLLPVRESPYEAISLDRIKKQIADAAGSAETDADENLTKAFKAKSTDIYERIAHLFSVMDRGDAAVNVPQYNGKLFWTQPPSSDEEPGQTREATIARFLNEHRVPDRYLAVAIDRLGRVPDDKIFSLVFVDYKSMGVRQLGSIYEGLLEYKLAIADEDLTTEKAKGKERYIPLSKTRGTKTRRSAEVVVRKGEPYLTTDNAERKATGSYYTPDHIVEYIVEHAVGPVLDQKLDSLRSTFRKAEKTWQTAYQNAQANPKITKTGLASEPRPPAEYAQQQTFDKHRDLVDDLFNLKVLDPAMGSGHFLVEAVDFVTDRIIDFLNRFPHNPIYTALARTRKDIVEACAEQGVNVDPFDDRLNDVHLLKRQVLKRCIYGVDLNPLATELSKVSLWLDAFTLGAPLSFLDHHLRPGNSLIGASFEEMEEAMADKKAMGTLAMFGIDYEPMSRAIKNVLRISRLSDATAAEARQSAEGYVTARSELDGYRILFDLLVARHFGFEKQSTDILLGGKQLDTKSAKALLGSLKQSDRPVVNAVEQVAADRRFFHWELEFPEVFFQLSSDVGIVGSTQQLKPLPDEERGFDAIVGNPPWGEFSDASALSTLATFAPVAGDLAEAFVCIAYRQCRLGGRVGQVLPDTLLSPAKAQIRHLMLSAMVTSEMFNIGPDWFTAEVRMAAILWQAYKGQSTGYRFSSCILPIEDRKAAQREQISLTEAICRTKREVDSSSCLADPMVPIPLFGSLEMSALFDAATRNAPSLGELCEHGRGVELNKAGLVIQCPSCEMWCPPAAATSTTKTCGHCGEIFSVSEVRSRTLVTNDDPGSPEWRPYLVGDEIHRYEKPGIAWIDISIPGVNFKDDGLYQSPKLCIRQAGVGVNAIVDLEMSALCPQSVYIYRVKPHYRKAGYDELLLLSYLSSRLFHLQVFMEFGEIDSSRAFSKLTHQRLAQLHAVEPDVLASHAVEVEHLRTLTMKLAEGRSRSPEDDDWKVEGLWSVIHGIEESSIDKFVRAFSRIHEGELLLKLFPGGVKGREGIWVERWLLAIKSSRQSVTETPQFKPEGGLP